VNLAPLATAGGFETVLDDSGILARRSELVCSSRSLRARPLKLQHCPARAELQFEITGTVTTDIAAAILNRPVKIHSDDSAEIIFKAE
jgi:hypothetical protein